MVNERERYKGLFADWEVGVAINVITRFRRQWECLSREGFEDLQQRCLTKWHLVKCTYDPLAGASQQTYMAKVIERELLHIVEELTSDKRNVFNNSVSLYQPLSDEEDSPALLDKLAADEDYPTDPEVSIALRVDIVEVLKKLSPRQRELCRLILEEGLNIKKASQILKIPRSTIYEDIKRLRVIFKKEGLYEYL